MKRKKYSGEGLLGKAAILSVLGRVGLIEKVTFERTLEGEGISQNCERNVPSRRNSSEKALRWGCAWCE